MCAKVVAKLRRHIKEVHRVKHNYFSCTSCSWASLRRSDVVRHCASANHGSVQNVYVEAGFDELQKCDICCFVALDLNTHKCGDRLHRFKGSALPATSTAPASARSSDHGAPSGPAPMSTSSDTGAPAIGGLDDDCYEVVHPDDPTIASVVPISAPPATSAASVASTTPAPSSSTPPEYIPLPDDLLDISLDGFTEGGRFPRVTVQFDVADHNDGSVDLVLPEYDTDLGCNIPDFVLF